nr:hypothetical protein [Tanacetum cinerariifolium]
MPPKPDLVFNNAPNDVETDHPAFNVKLSPTKPTQDLSHTNRPSAPIIEDCVSDSEDESHVETSIPPGTHKTAIPKPTSNENRKNMKACFVCKSLDHLIKDYDYHAKKMVQPTARNHAHRGTHKQYAQLILPNRQRHVVPTTVLTQSKPVPITAARLVISAVPNYPSLKASNSPLRVTAVKALVVNAAQGNSQHALKDKGVINSGCSRHMTGNMPYLSDFEELNGGYVAFRGNPKGGKISSKGSGPTWLFNIDTLTKTMNYQPVTAGNQTNPSTELEDITYSNDDVGTKANFNNLETSITVNPIPTIRVHKDHPMTQIIGFKDPDPLDKVYKVVKALYVYTKLLEL